MNSGYFKDKVVWITGASSGIGEALALELAPLGCKLILSGRREDELKRVAAQCTQLGSEAVTVAFDLGKTAELPSLAKRTEAIFGRIDILVNNGGFSQRSVVLETPEALEREIMEVNYFAPTVLTRAVLPGMVSRGYGHIVVMSSIAGKFGFFLRSSYSAAKHALHGYFESLRLEYYRNGIQVTLICPGKVKTNVSINAKGAHGNTHGKMDESHETAMSAKEAAVIMIRAISGLKEEVFVGGKELKAVTLKRLFPSLFSKLIRKQKAE